MKIKLKRILILQVTGNANSNFFHRLYNVFNNVRPDWKIEFQPFLLSNVKNTVKKKKKFKVLGNKQTEKILIYFDISR